MIVPDLNLLVYAYSAGMREHAASRAWWEGLLSGSVPVGIPWVVSVGFVRLMTRSSIVACPMTPKAAVAHVRSWLVTPGVSPLEPGPRHLEIFERLVVAIGVVGNLASDAHLAAIAIEHQCEFHSNDADFARFSGLRWVNPLAR